MGDYRLVAHLGGPVYEAHDQRGRRFALKRLRRTADAHERSLFERGAGVLSHLDHPNLPKLEAVFEDPRGAPVVVQPLLAGGDLQARVARRLRLSAGDLEAMTRRLLGLLDYLHTRVPPVIHRDIKPRNLVFRSEGATLGIREPLLVDFDTIVDKPDPTGETIVVSAGYTAPEQLAGAATPRSDLYSLGATLFFAATHVEPEEVPRDARGRLRLEGRLTHLPRRLAELIEALLQPLPEGRPASAAAALAALDAPQPVAPKKAAPPRYGPLIAAVAGGLFVLGLGVVMLNSRKEPEPKQEVTAESPSLPVPQLPVKASPPPAPKPPPTPEPPQSPPLLAFSAHIGEGCGVYADGSLACGHSRRPGEWVEVPGLEQVTQVEVSGHRCALAKGGLYCWGDNARGALGGPSEHIGAPTKVPFDDVVDVTVGRHFSCAVDRAGEVRCWGRAAFGALGEPDRRSASTPTPVAGLPPIRALDAGSTHVCAISQEGEAWCWGAGRSGQLGDGGRHRKSAPVRVEGLRGVVGVGAAWKHSCALLEGGTVHCWGANGRRELGDGTLEDRLTPVDVGLEEVDEIVLGWTTTCARKREGQVHCWGPSGATRGPPGPEGPQSVPLQQPAHSIAMRANTLCVISQTGQLSCL